MDFYRRRQILKFKSFLLNSRLRCCQKHLDGLVDSICGFMMGKILHLALKLSITQHNGKQMKSVQLKLIWWNLQVYKYVYTVVLHSSYT